MFETAELDWKTIPAGDEEDGITDLIDGFKTVPEYRRDRSIMDREAYGGEGWNLPWYGDWYQSLTPSGTQNAWEDDRGRIHIHEAEYAVFEEYGFNWCRVRVTASAADDIDPATGDRMEEPVGHRGRIHITGILPGAVDAERYVEQHLDPDA